MNQVSPFLPTDFLILKTFYHSSFQKLIPTTDNIISIIPYDTWLSIIKVLVCPLGINCIQNISRNIPFLFEALTQVLAFKTLFLYLRDVPPLPKHLQGGLRKSTENQVVKKEVIIQAKTGEFYKEGMVNKNGKNIK